jgi:hypothetical protein
MLLLIHNLLDILGDFRDMPCQYVYILLLEFFIEYLLTLIINGMNSFDNRLHTSTGFTDHVPELTFHSSYLLQAQKLYTFLK